MKTPRVKDFDPNAQTLKSSLEHMPAIERPTPSGATAILETTRPAQEPREAAFHPNASISRTDVRPDDRTGINRRIKRHAFEFYQDQLDILKRISLQEQMEGEKGSQSAMVREALDEYLAKRRGT